MASTLSLGSKKERATSTFGHFIQETYIPFAVQAMDMIRMFGFVVYALVKEGGTVTPHVVPFGCFNVEIALSSTYKTVLRATSKLSASQRSPPLYVYTDTHPSMNGAIVSALSSLAPRIISQRLLTAAAVEGDLNAALPTLITQTIPDQRNAAADIYNNSELEGFFGSHATDVIANREASQNTNGINMLARQQELAKSINAETLGTQQLGKAVLNAGIMCLPKNQQLANHTLQQTRQDISGLREDLSRQICSAMGVPLGLLDPSATSMHNESLTCKVFSTQLAKQAHVVQKLLSDVYTLSFKGKAKNPSWDTQEASFTLLYQSFTSAADLYAAYDREVIDESKIRIQIARNLGMTADSISKLPRKREEGATAVSNKAQKKTSGD
jgi:hypothetical protein